MLHDVLTNVITVYVKYHLLVYYKIFVLRTMYFHKH